MDSVSAQGNRNPEHHDPVLEVQLRTGQWMLMEQSLDRAVPEVLPLLGETWGVRALELLLAQPKGGRETEWVSFYRWECAEYRHTVTGPKLERVMREQIDEKSPGQDQGSEYGSWPLPTGRPVKAWLGWEGQLSVDRCREWILLLGAACVRHVALEEYRLLAAERQRMHHTTNLLLARASHELRTPLIALKGIAALLEARWQTMSDSRRAEALGHVRRSGERLETLVENILSLARLEAGQRPFRQERIALSTLPDRYRYLVSGLLEGRAVVFIPHVADDAPRYLETDPAALDEILENLLGNAAKYTAEGTIELRVRRESAEDNRTVLIEVWDTGTGIPGDIDELVDSLAHGGFHPSTPGHRSEKGTGLGLSIVWRLAEFIGATFYLAKNTPQGTIAGIRLPQQPPGR